MKLLDDLHQSVIEGDMHSTHDSVQKALARGISPGRILKESFIFAVGKVGARFENGDFYVPEMLISARAIKSGLALLPPHLVAANDQAVGKVVIGTVQGNLHDIGRNLVGMMLEGAGFEVIDLGADISAEKFAAAAREHQPDLIASSALLTTAMPSMQNIIRLLDETGLLQHVKMKIGAAPVTDAYASQIGVDGFASDAAAAASLARALLGENI